MHIFNNRFNSDEEFEQATYRIMETRLFQSFPKPAEWFETRKEDLDIKVQRAKEKLKEAIRQYGAYQTICFDDPIIHCVVRSFGGWVKLCKTDIETLENYFKFEFKREYQAYSSRKDNKVPLLLQGIAQSTNEGVEFREGIEYEEKVNYIGNKQKCLAWNKAYFNKNQNCLINKSNYQLLGYTEKPLIEHVCALDSVNGVGIAEELVNEHREEMKKPTGIEYSQEQLLKMIRRG